MHNPRLLSVAPSQQTDRLFIGCLEKSAILPCK